MPTFIIERNDFYRAVVTAPGMDALEALIADKLTAEEYSRLNQLLRAGYQTSSYKILDKDNMQPPTHFECKGYGQQQDMNAGGLDEVEPACVWHPRHGHRRGWVSTKKPGQAYMPVTVFEDLCAKEGARPGGWQISEHEECGLWWDLGDGRNEITLVRIPVLELSVKAVRLAPSWTRFPHEANLKLKTAAGEVGRYHTLHECLLGARALQLTESATVIHLETKEPVAIISAEGEVLGAAGDLIGVRIPESVWRTPIVSYAGDESTYGPFFVRVEASGTRPPRIELICVDSGESWCAATKLLPTTPPGGCAWIKEYSENEGVTACLVAHGIIDSAVAAQAESGHVTLNAHKVLVEPYTDT